MLKNIKRTIIFRVKGVYQGVLYPGVEKIIGKPDFMMMVPGEQTTLPDKKMIEYISQSKSGTLGGIKNDKLLNNKTNLLENEDIRIHMVGTTHPSKKDNVMEVEPMKKGGIRQFFSKNLIIDGGSPENRLVQVDKLWKFGDEETLLNYKKYLLGEIIRNRSFFQYWDVADGCYKPLPPEQIEKWVELNKLFKTTFPNVWK